MTIDLLAAARAVQQAVESEGWTNTDRAFDHFLTICGRSVTESVVWHANALKDEVAPLYMVENTVRAMLDLRRFLKMADLMSATNVDKATRLHDALMAITKNEPTDYEAARRLIPRTRESWSTHPNAWPIG